jgi:hypothetical protein
MDGDIDRDEAIEIKTRVVEPEEIYTETRGQGSRILVVEDHMGQEFTDFAHNHTKVEADKQDYLGETVELRYSVNRDGFLNFEGFGDFTDEPVADEPVLELSNRDLSITRQSAAHDATRIVAAQIEASAANDTLNQGMSEEAIKRDLQKWTDYFKTYHRNGNWPDKGGSE